MEQERTCYTCTKSALCYIYVEMQLALNVMPLPTTENPTAGTRENIFKAIAEACPLYQKKKI